MTKNKNLVKILPDKSICIAHGQMDEKRLEKIMQDFGDKKFDVLLCTTIIESGIDFPNVNTLIIDESDKFGLSQLYQIRGRIGRGNVQGYAYLLVEKNKSISDKKYLSTMLPCKLIDYKISRNIENIDWSKIGHSITNDKFEYDVFFYVY